MIPSKWTDYWFVNVFWNIYSDNDDIILYRYYHGISTGITWYILCQYRLYCIPETYLVWWHRIIITKKFNTCPTWYYVYTIIYYFNDSIYYFKATGCLKLGNQKHRSRSTGYVWCIVCVQELSNCRYFLTKPNRLNCTKIPKCLKR